MAAAAGGNTPTENMQGVITLAHPEAGQASCKAPPCQGKLPDAAELPTAGPGND
jgi:hypothetical protein